MSELTETFRSQSSQADDVEDVLTVDEVASLLRVNKKTIYDACQRKEIPCQKIGRIFRFSRAAVILWLNGQGRVSHLKG